MAMERENKAPRAGAPANRKRRKVCQFCVDKCEYIDYKDVYKRQLLTCRVALSFRFGPTDARSGVLRGDHRPV